MLKTKDGILSLKSNMKRKNPFLKVPMQTQNLSESDDKDVEIIESRPYKKIQNDKSLNFIISLDPPNE